MKTKIFTVAVVLLLGYMVVGSMGQPNGTGQPVMSALVGIQEAIISLASEPEPAEEKEWYHGHFKIESNKNDALLVVPAGRQFVLLRLYSAPDSPTQTEWYLAANETPLLDGSINKYSCQNWQNIKVYKYKHDFPDGCITIDSNETLNAVNDYPLGDLNIIVIGYFRNMPL